jgi:hypothetical protein
MPNWRASQSPQAYWADDTLVMSGIEDLSLDHTNSSAGGGILFFNAYNCWVRNIRSLNSTRSHVWNWRGAAHVIRDSYFYGTKNAQSQSYGIEFYNSSDVLVENNIFQHITTPIQVNGTGSGSVVAYNYFTDMYYAQSPGFMISANSLHAEGVDYLLFEGNEGNAFQGDGVHGTHHFVTVFRNYYNGWETGKTGETIPINLYSFSRYMNVIGNVLGRAGYHTVYEWNLSGSNRDKAIFALGDTPGGSVPTDPQVKNTLFRWGNYDVVTNTSRFQATEVPSGLSQFRNPVPSNQTLPNSLYLLSRPSWFGSTPWPAIGPDVSGGPGPGGHVHSIPARACFDSTPKSGNILNFNGADCYGGGGTTPPPPAPAAPTNVRVIR